jgi:hypothetical protein
MKNIVLLVCILFMICIVGGVERGLLPIATGLLYSLIPGIISGIIVFQKYRNGEI